MTLRSRLPDRVAEVLRDRIRNEMASGERLPSEAHLAQELDVSRASVREALKQLFSEGLVDRRWGAGTFVREPSGPVAFDVTEVSTTREVIASAGHEATLSFVDICLGSTTPQIAESLGLGAAEPVWRVERVFAIDGRPAVHLVDRLVPVVNGHHVDPTVLKDVDLDMMTLLQRETGVSIAGSEGSLDAVAASGEIAERLAVRIGTPLLRQRLMNVAADETPLINTEIHHVSELVSFRLVRHRRG